MRVLCNEMYACFPVSRLQIEIKVTVVNLHSKRQALLKSLLYFISCRVQTSCFWKLSGLLRKCYFPKSSITPVLSQPLFSYLIYTQVRYQKQKMFPFFPLSPYSKRCCILFLLLNPCDSCCGFLSKSVVSSSFFFFLFHFPVSVTLTRSE